LLGAGKLTVTVPGELVLPWEFCTVYWKVTEVAPVFEGSDRMNPPLGSTTRVAPAGGVGAGEVTTVIGKPLGSEFPIRRPGDAIFT
jgi:hypothetical protein